MAITSDTQQSKGLSPIDNQMKGIQGRNPTTLDQKESYPDLFLPVVENYRISDCFCDTWKACLQITIPWF